MPAPGVTSIRASMSAKLSLPAARAAATACSDGDARPAAAGRSTPAKMMSVAWPRIFGTDHASAPRWPRRARRSATSAQRGPGAAGRSSRLADGPKSSTSRPACPCASTADRRRRARPPRRPGRPAPRPASVGRPPLMPPPPRSAGRPRSRRTSGQVSSSSSWRPMPTTSPSSSTTIWSASMMVDTRCATMTHGGVARSPAAAPRAAARRCRGPAPRTSRRRGRSPAGAPAPGRWPGAAAGRRRRSCRPARSGASSPLRHRLDEVAGLRDLEASPQLLVGRVRVAVAQVGGDRAGEQVRLLRHEADPVPQPSESSSRTSTPSTSTSPPVASNSRGISESSVVLPAPVLPMIAVVWPGPARKLMSRSTGASAPG